MGLVYEVGEASPKSQRTISASESLPTLGVGTPEGWICPSLPFTPTTLSIPSRAVDSRLLRLRSRATSISQDIAKNRSRPPTSWAGLEDRERV